MSDFEIKTRFGPTEAFLWHFKFSSGERVILDWPELKKFVVDSHDRLWIDCGGAEKVEIHSDDPNQHYRPFLEKNVGVQNKDWMWKHIGGPKDYSRDQKLEIRFRKNKAKWATMLRLQWGGE